MRNQGRSGRTRIGIVSIMHFMIDFLCAYAVFGTFRYQYDPFKVYLYYSFFAFALQMPLGIVLDRITGEGKQPMDRPAFRFTAAGLAVTMLGTLTNPVILGIGNALFHTGGGGISIQEDDREGMNGRGLGVFVAPGAIGLFLGGQISTFSKPAVLGISGVILAVLCAILYQRVRSETRAHASMPELNLKTPEDLGVILACFAVVIIRSAVGTAVTFSWKSGFALSFLAVVLLACGKSAGGFLAASFGFRKTAVCTLGAAAVCYLFKDFLPAGCAALFLFNMTMPMTLYILAKRMPGMPGFAFGILTFALYLGFILIYATGLQIPYIGTAGSLISAVLLAWAAEQYER